VAAIDTSKVKLTEEQKEQLGAMEGFKERSKPESKKKEAEKEVRQITGDYASLYEKRSNQSAEGEMQAMYYFLIWDILLFMFLGMAFFKLGILQGEAKTSLYTWMTIIGLGVGLPLSYLFLQPDIVHKFNSFIIAKEKVFNFYEIQRLVHSIGIFGLIMLMYKSGWFKWLFTMMRPVGRMAFSNYLLQSLICGLIFYGIGFGLFGKLQRYELYYVVVSVWIFEIVLSHVWMRYFAFGPFEWLWRSLTYWKKQPFKKKKNLESTLLHDNEKLSLHDIQHPLSTQRKEVD
jgi:uncharacterized protein